MVAFRRIISIVSASMLSSASSDLLQNLSCGLTWKFSSSKNCSAILSQDGFPRLSLQVTDPLFTTKEAVFPAHGGDSQTVGKIIIFEGLSVEVSGADSKLITEICAKVCPFRGACHDECQGCTSTLDQETEPISSINSKSTRCFHSSLLKDVSIEYFTKNGITGIMLQVYAISRDESTICGKSSEGSHVLAIKERHLLPSRTNISNISWHWKDTNFMHELSPQENDFVPLGDNRVDPLVDALAILIIDSSFIKATEYDILIQRVLTLIESTSTGINHIWIFVWLNNGSTIEKHVNWNTKSERDISIYQIRTKEALRHSLMNAVKNSSASHTMHFLLHSRMLLLSEPLVLWQPSKNDSMVEFDARAAVRDLERTLPRSAVHLPVYYPYTSDIMPPWFDFVLSLNALSRRLSSSFLKFRVGSSLAVVDVSLSEAKFCFGGLVYSSPFAASADIMLGRLTETSAYHAILCSRELSLSIIGSTKKRDPLIADFSSNALIHLPFPAKEVEVATTNNPIEKIKQMDPGKSPLITPVCPVKIYIHKIVDNFTTESYTDISIYASEQRILHGLLESECRTFNPVEADYFFVPAMVSYAAHQDLGKKSGLGAELQRAFDLLSESFRYISDPLNNPYFGRRKGNDHFWVISQDIGACLAPTEMLNGRRNGSTMDGPFFLQTNGDHSHEPQAILDYVKRSTQKLSHNFKQRLLNRYQPCYREGKDVVIPPHFVEPESVPPDHLGDLRKKRPIFIHFRGSVRNEPLYYSRGIRQWMRDNLASVSRRDNSQIDASIYVKFELLHGPNGAALYWAELQQSTFCLCPPGWVGWSPRFYQAMLAGCIPVLIGEKSSVDLPFPHTVPQLLNLTVQISPDELPALKEILMGIAFEEVIEMRYGLRDAWKDFAFDAHFQILQKRRLKNTSKGHLERSGVTSILNELSWKSKRENARKN